MALATLARMNTTMPNTKTALTTIDPDTELVNKLALYRAVIEDMTRQLQREQGKLTLRVRIPAELVGKEKEAMLTTAAGSILILPTLVV